MRQSREPRALLDQARRITANAGLIAVALAGATFLLYWRTAAPSVLPGDSGELQFAAWGFWLAHPTGYPLYLVLGGIWQHLVQVGDPAFRLNLFSGLWAALAISVAFLAFRTITQRNGAAVIAALTLAVSPLFWSQATRAEVYSLNLFFVALLTLWARLWRAETSRRYAIAFALTLGLALAHHRTIILLAPAFAALFAEKFFSANFQLASFARRALVYGALALVPLALYLYIPLRAGATPYATISLAPAAQIVIFDNSPLGWLSVILGSGFSGALGIDQAAFAALRNFPAQWLVELNPLGVLLSLLGLGMLAWQKKFAEAAFCFYGGVTLLLFNSVYHIGDIADYYTPIYFFSCLAIAAFIGFVQVKLQTFPLTRASLLGTIFLLACFALLPLQNLSANFFTQDHSRQLETRRQWAMIFEARLPDNAILISNDRDEMTPLYYLQLVEKQHAGWVGLFPKIAPGTEYENVVALVRRVASSKRPIYTIKPIPALALRFNAQAVENGMWLIKTDEPRTPLNPTEVQIGDSLRINGYSLVEGQAIAGERITLAVQFRVLRALTHDYTSSLQLFDPNGSKVSQGNDHVPGQGEYPPTKWRVGETLQDQFDIELDPSLKDAEYGIWLRFYEPSSGDELGDLTQVGTIHIER